MVDFLKTMSLRGLSSDHGASVRWVHGEHDRIVSYLSAGKWAADLGGRFITLEGAGHLLMAPSGRDLLREAVVDGAV